MRKVLIALVVFLLAAAASAKELSVLWFYDDPSELAFVKQAFAEYTAQHPDVTFKLNTVSYDNLFTKVTQLIAGGTPPDIVKLTDVRPEFAPFVLDLSKYEGKDFLKPFIPGVARGMERGGKIIGAPLDVTANGIILNKSYFQKAGVSIPNEQTGWTWTEFEKAIREVTTKTQARFPLVWDVTPHRWLTFLYENGGSIFKDNGTANGFDTQASINALTKFAAMNHDGLMPLSVWGGTDNPRDLFFSGQAVAWMSGSWQVKAMEDGIKNFDWTAGPNPSVTTRSSVLGYKFVSAFNTSKYPADAADFIRFFTSKEMQRKYAQQLTVIPARTDVGTVDYGNPQATEALNNLAYELKISPLAASSDVTNPAIAYVWDTLKENIVAVTLKQETPQQAVTKVSAAIDKGLAATH